MNKEINITKGNISSTGNPLREFKVSHSFLTEVHFVSLRQAALYWVEKGYNVIPIKRFGSTPATPNGLKDATSDISIIKEWFSSIPVNGIPRLNIATVPREGSPRFDLDIDKHALNGVEQWRKLTTGKEVPRTLTELTQSGGLHLSLLGESPVKSRVGILDGIDIIGQKHYAIRAPSVREKGAYHVFDWKIANAPSWLLGLLESEKEVKQPTKKAIINYNGSNAVESERIISALENVWGNAPSGHSYRANMALALSGYLLRKDVPANDVKWIISELGRRTGHADHSRVVDYTLNKLLSGSERVTGATTLNEIVEEVESCLK
jgi:hypothetical protein